jgi:hypothetical protein
MQTAVRRCTPAVSMLRRALGHVPGAEVPQGASAVVGGDGVPLMIAVVRGACPELWHGARVLDEIKGSMLHLCVELCGCKLRVFREAVDATKLPASYPHAWAAEFGESELHCTTAMRTCLSSRHYMGSDRRPSSRGLVRSAGCILSDRLLAS